MTSTPLLAITAVYDVLKYPVNDCTKLAVLSDFDQVLGLRSLRKGQGAATGAGESSPLRRRLHDISESGEKKETPKWSR